MRRAVALLVIFLLWTVVVRIAISDGSRFSAWIPARFNDWPAEIEEVRGSPPLQFSIFATFAADGTGRAETLSTTSDLLGRAVVGTVIDTADADNINGSRFVTGARAGSVSSMSVFVPEPIDAAPHDQYQMAIYEDDRGAPRTLLASTASRSLQANAWNTAPITATLRPRTAYWLMYNTNGSNTGVNNATYTRAAGDVLDRAIRAYESDSLRRRADQVTAIAGMMPMVVALIVVALFLGRGPLARVSDPGRRLRGGHAHRSGPSRNRVRAVRHVSERARTAHHVRGCGALLDVPRRSVRIASGLVVLIVCVAVVYGTRHFSDEVIGGMLFGGGMATGAVAVASRRPNGHRPHRHERCQPTSQVQPTSQTGVTPDVAWRADDESVQRG